MKNINIGIANLIISSKLNKSYYSDNLITESKKIALDFFEIVKDSPILQLEFKVYNNIEGKYIDNDLFAKEYIDNNIKLFEIYTLEEVEAEHKKLRRFLVENASLKTEDSEYSIEKVALYSAINSLIIESLKLGECVDVDVIHESFTSVFNHIKTKKIKLVEDEDVHMINEEVLEIAVAKFNEKYASLDESDRTLLSTLIKSSAKEKKSLLETYKTSTLSLLNEMNKSNTKDNVSKAIKKITEMVYDKNNIDDNIIELHELERDLS